MDVHTNPNLYGDPNPMKKNIFLILLKSMMSVVISIFITLGALSIAVIDGFSKRGFIVDLLVGIKILIENDNGVVFDPKISLLGLAIGFFL